MVQLNEIKGIHFVVYPKTSLLPATHLIRQSRLPSYNRIEKARKTFHDNLHRETI